LAITAFVSVIAYTSLSSVISGVESMRESTRRTYEVNRALMIISRDFREFIARPVRDEYGEVEHPIVGGPAARFMLSLTRSGWHNPNRHPRSNLQRVNYRLEDQALWRDAYAVLDRASDTEPQSVMLLEDVEFFELRFLGDLSFMAQQREEDKLDTSSWPQSWVAGPAAFTTGGPPAAGGAGNYTLPPAVELRLELSDWGEIRRLYVLPPL